MQYTIPNMHSKSYNRVCRGINRLADILCKLKKYFMKTTEDIQIVKQNLKQQLFETRLNNILFKEKMIINASGIILGDSEKYNLSFNNAPFHKKEAIEFCINPRLFNDDLLYNEIISLSCACLINNPLKHILNKYFEICREININTFAKNNEPIKEKLDIESIKEKVYIIKKIEKNSISITRRTGKDDIHSKSASTSYLLSEKSKKTEDKQLITGVLQSLNSSNSERTFYYGGSESNDLSSSIEYSLSKYFNKYLAENRLQYESSRRFLSRILQESVFTLKQEQQKFKYTTCDKELDYSDKFRALIVQLNILFNPDFQQLDKIKITNENKVIFNEATHKSCIVDYLCDDIYIEMRKIFADIFFKYREYLVNFIEKDIYHQINKDFIYIYLYKHNSIILSKRSVYEHYKSFFSTKNIC